MTTLIIIAAVVGGVGVAVAIFSIGLRMYRWVFIHAFKERLSAM